MIAPDELVIDLFAGGGGASMGIERALGRSPDIAVNHSADAIAMHARNHPTTKRYRESVWKVRPCEVCRGRRVGLLHASPDCTYHSRARGGKPRDGKARSLASVVICWAREVGPRIIVLENVEEWLDWGPLDNEGQPIKEKAGRSFRNWLGKLKAQGYRVEWRILNAADYGAPTSRKRVFLVARNDGEPIRWPWPTHGKGTGRPHRGAHEIIDWTDLGESIFTRRRALADNTLRRIAAGVKRHVIDTATPFIAPTNDGLVVPTLVQSGYGERPGQSPRVPGLAKPLGTVVTDSKHRLVAAMLTKHFGGVVGHGVQLPLGAITTKDHHAVTTAELDEGTDHSDEVHGFLVKYYGAAGRPESQQQSLLEPLHTITTKARFGLVTVHGRPYRIVDIRSRMLRPRELFDAQGFPRSYVIDEGADGRQLTLTAQNELVGNSVCPDVEHALVAANTRPTRAREAA